LNHAKQPLSDKPWVHGDAEENEDSPVESEWRELALSSEHHGERLDRVLAGLIPEFSRSYLQQLIEQGCVSFNSEARALTKPSLRMKAGQVLKVELRPTAQSQAFVPQAMALDTVHCDPFLRVIHKPAGLVVHPAPGHWSGTLLNGLLALDSAASLLPRAGIVHRLDKDTSGLMLVARTRSSMDALVAQIAAREVHREYLAIVQGAWPEGQVKDIEEPVGRDPRNRLRMAVVDLARHPGKTAHTTVTGLAATPDASLVHCQLHTGRTHQIRVHLAHSGFPLLGDSLYGGKDLAGLSRQALHAFRLSLAHPQTQAPLTLQAPLPNDLKAALAALGLRYNEKTV
jgi:23S rRNA pseudouridine1911/1915/1917 synthase